MDADLHEYYLGSAYVPLHNLLYLESQCNPDHCTGCCMTDNEHNLPVLVKPTDLEVILEANKVKISQLHRISDYPRLLCTETLVLSCLHGEFRIKHGKNANAPSWWPVDLYCSDISYELCNRIRRFYQSHKPPCDGEIYLRIRYHQKRNAVGDAATWLSKLSSCKQSSINQIVRKDSLRVILDKLEEYRGLWNNFRISSLPSILSWRCYEETCAYLQRILETWKALTLGNPHWCDYPTVQRIQGLAPVWSRVDQAKIERLIRSRKVFSRVDIDSREAILQVINQSRDFIPSFSTFYKHTKMIGPSMLALRQLLPGRKARPSMYVAFENCYKASYHLETSLLIQYDEVRERTFESNSHMAMKMAYFQLFLAAFRQEKNLPTHIKGINAESSGWLIRIACTAYRLGFRTDLIDRLRECNADISDIRQNMLKERPENSFWVKQDLFSREAQLRHDRQVIFERRRAMTRFSMTVEDIEETTHVRNHSIFLPDISKALNDGEKGEHLSGFGKLVLALSIFFGGEDARSWLVTTTQLMHSQSYQRSVSRYSELSRIESPNHASTDPASDPQSQRLSLNNMDDLDDMLSYNIPLSPPSDPTIGSIIFIEMMHPPGNILYCLNDLKAVADTLTNLKSSGFKILLTAMGQFQNDRNTEARLRKIRPHPRVILNLHKQLHNLVVYCCPSAVHLGKRVKDLPPKYSSIRKIESNR